MGLVSVAEAAKFLGVSEETVKRRIRRGELVGKQHPRPQGYAWMVEIPNELQATNNDTHHDINTDHDDAITPQQLVTGDGSIGGELKRLDQMVVILEKQATLHQEEMESRRREVQELHVLLQQAHAALPAPRERGPWWHLWKG
mgnify:CR=1 FL=1